ncbi:MAG: hypothetical protein R3F43_19840 [bacterium]
MAQAEAGPGRRPPRGGHGRDGHAHDVAVYDLAPIAADVEGWRTRTAAARDACQQQRDALEAATQAWWQAWRQYAAGGGDTRVLWRDSDPVTSRPWPLVVVALAACDPPADTCGQDGLAVLPDAVQFGDVRRAAADRDPTTADQSPPPRRAAAQHLRRHAHPQRDLPHRGRPTATPAPRVLPGAARAHPARRRRHRRRAHHLRPPGRHTDRDLDKERSRPRHPGQSSPRRGHPTRRPGLRPHRPGRRGGRRDGLPRALHLPAGEAIADLCTR